MSTKDLEDISDKDLQKAFKQRTEGYCDAEKVRESTLYPGKYNVDQGTCWLCWMRLTGQELKGWRKPPYFISRLRHGSECPVCGYTHWIGATWFPFIYLQEQGKFFLSNPSFRRGKNAKRNKHQ